MKRRLIAQMASSESVSKRAGRRPSGTKPEFDGLAIDRYRSIVFPNRVREYRKRLGMAKLLGLSAALPQIPYIRLSKIERGEVVAKAHEITAIARALNITPADLLIDIDISDFDIAEWAADLQDWFAIDLDEDRFSVLLAAAIRARRERDKALTIAHIERDYGIAPVILSRLENAFKPLSRWNDATVTALCQLFDVPDAAALRGHVMMLWAEGTLTPFLGSIANPETREAKTRARVEALRHELTLSKDAPPRKNGVAVPRPPTAPAVPSTPHEVSVRLLPVRGTPLADGLIAPTETDDLVEAPRIAGANAYGLRVCRPTLGPGLPARATLVVDPDRFPSAGGLAIITENAGLRLVMVTFGRNGEMLGISVQPALEIDLGGIDPACIATVISAVYE